VARPEKQGQSVIAENRRGSFVAVARCLLSALAEGREEDAWDQAQALAKSVLDDPLNALARGVLDAGPFAMRKAEELAEHVVAQDGQAQGGEASRSSFRC
jgi:hypothetical protein